MEVKVKRGVVREGEGVGGKACGASGVTLLWLPTPHAIGLIHEPLLIAAFCGTEPSFLYGCGGLFRRTLKFMKKTGLHFPA